MLKLNEQLAAYARVITKRQAAARGLTVFPRAGHKLYGSHSAVRETHLIQ